MVSPTRSRCWTVPFAFQSRRRHLQSDGCTERASWHDLVAESIERVRVGNTKEEVKERERESKHRHNGSRGRPDKEHGEAHREMECHTWRCTWTHTHTHTHTHTKPCGGRHRSYRFRHLAWIWPIDRSSSTANRSADKNKLFPCFTALHFVRRPPNNTAASPLRACVYERNVPVTFFFFSCLSTLGHWLFTLPARAREPCCLP